MQYNINHFINKVERLPEDAALYDIKQILAVKEAQSIISGPKEPEESDDWDNSGLGQLQPEWLPDEEECEYEEEEDLFEKLIDALTQEVQQSKPE